MLYPLSYSAGGTRLVYGTWTRAWIPSNSTQQYRAPSLAQLLPGVGKSRIAGGSAIYGLFAQSAWLGTIEAVAQRHCAIWRRLRLVLDVAGDCGELGSDLIGLRCADSYASGRSLII